MGRFARLAGAALVLSGVASTPALAADSAVVFMYHRFGDTRYPSTSVRLAQFDAHLDHLAAEDYTVWPLARIVAHLRAGKSLPERTVALTVDDAYRSVYEHAYPRLKARGWPFTVFVSTDGVDHGLPELMSWAQMREMQAHGASFANHSASHDYLIRRRAGEDAAAWRVRVRADIERAQARLRAELGTAPPLFAYPYGEYSRTLADLVAELGLTAFGQHSGALGPHSDWRALPRFPMAEAFAELSDFAAKAAALPLPVIAYQPFDPISAAARPRLEVTLAPGLARASELACYVSGQGRTAVQWLEPGRRFLVQAREALPPGRSRYNCTAPSREPGRYYWFSQQWIVESDED